jgi:hypothetical protein
MARYKTLRLDAQPAYYIVKEQGRTFGVVAQAIDVPYMHLRNALYGQVVPSPEVRNRLPKLLGKDVAELFDAAMLAREYRPNYGRKK